MSCKHEVNLQRAEGTESPRNYFVTYHQEPKIGSWYPPSGRGEGGGDCIPYCDLYRGDPPKSAFFMLQVYERIAISALEANRKGREICHFSL